MAWISKRSTGIYCKIDCVWVLLFLLTALAWAQPAGPLKPVFPDDTQDPKQAGGAELLEAVCPGHVLIGEHVECKVVCPEGSGFSGEDYEWDLRRVLRGHFLSPTSDDTVLSMGGCESHALNFGGTILLTRRAGKWMRLWYKGEIPTGECHRVKLESGREILICYGSYGGQGNVWTDLYFEDLLMPLSALMSGKEGTVFSAFDNSYTCCWNSQNESKPVRITRITMERVEFQTAADGAFRGLSVFGRHGERSMTVAQVEACTDEQIPTRPHRGLDFRPLTKPYRVDFRFDDGRMVRVRSRPGGPK